MNSLQRVALWLASTPLALGALLFGAWWFTQVEWLMAAGVLDVYLGLVVTVLVLCLLAVGSRRAIRDGMPPQQRRRHTFVVAMVMLANYPVAWLALWAGWRRFTMFTLTLSNQAATPWANLVIDGGGAHEVVASIAAGEDNRLALWFAKDGELQLRSEGSGAPIVVDGYVTPGIGGSAAVVRQRDGTIAVVETPR